MKRLAVIIATGFGAGLSPVWPGTAGTLVAVPFSFGISMFPLWAQALCAAAVFAISWWSAGVAEELAGEKDPGKIVVDEIAGFVFTMFGIHFGLRSAVAGFLLFRLFDVTKPFPAGAAERRLPGGLAITADDVVSGIYVNIALRVMEHYGIF